MKKDFLKREQTLNDLTMVVDRLSRIKRGATFALDGSWGSGKTFLLDMFEEIISEIQDEENCDNRFFIVKYDCWKYNFYSEPVIAILSAVREQVEKELKMFPNLRENEMVAGALELLKKYLREYGGKILESKWGFNPIEIYDSMRENGSKIKTDLNKEDTFYSFKQLLESIRTQLKKIAESKTIIFIVDDLDRCLPEYAISVLERLHHIFSDIPNFISLIAMDRQQLKKVVEHAYGTAFDVDAYLRKIIDFYFVIDNGELREHYLEKYEEYIDKFYYDQDEDFEWAERAITAALNNTTVREQEKLFLRAELIHEMITDSNLDVSSMVFEILSLRFNSMAEMKRFLLNFENDGTDFHSTIINYNGKKYSQLNANVYDLILWYVENIVADGDGQRPYCGEYSFQEYSHFEDIVVKMKLFFRLKNVICF